MMGDYLLGSKEYHRRYRQRPGNKEKATEAVRQWRIRNKDRASEMRHAYVARYRAAKLLRTPKFADHDVIDKIYKDCPKGMDVDHIIPLQGENVSGLHVSWNLQYLTPVQNKSKGNKHD